MPHRDRLRWAGLAVVAAVAFVLTALASTRVGAGVSVDEAVRGWILNELPGPLRQGLDRLARPLVIVVPNGVEDRYFGAAATGADSSA